MTTPDHAMSSSAAVTPEQIVEILARELYVLNTGTKRGRIATRQRWYLGIKAGIRDQYRDKARDLITQLRASELHLVHLVIRLKEAGRV